MLNEPVRGVIAEPSFRSLSGLEQLRAYLQGLRPRTPHARLLGYRLTQASSGNVVFNQPISPWFDVYDGFVDMTASAELAIWAPPTRWLLLGPTSERPTCRSATCAPAPSRTNR